MEKRKTIFYLLTGLVLFSLMLFLVQRLALNIEILARQDFNPSLAIVRRIPLYTMVVLGTVLLRPDWILKLFHGRLQFYWPALVIFGWPYLLFVVIIPILIYLFPESSSLLWAYYYFHASFGKHASVLAGILCGLGILWALKGHTDSPD